MIALLLSSEMLAAKAPLSVAVSPAQSIAPANLTIRVHVEPDADNRALEVVAESGAYYRSSRIQLDGIDAPRMIVIEIRNVPGGDYEVTGLLVNSAGKKQSVRTRVSVAE
jgi:hypothetical protein